MSISKPSEQMTLDFQPGLVDRFSSLREVIATGVYQHGLKRCAIDLDVAPGNLSVMVSDAPKRSFSVEKLERYMEKTGDLTPIYYLVEKFLSDKAAKQDAVNAETRKLLEQLAPLMRQSGILV